jgi:hypothetical protein
MGAFSPKSPFAFHASDGQTIGLQEPEMLPDIANMDIDDAGKLFNRSLIPLSQQSNDLLADW